MTDGNHEEHEVNHGCENWRDSQDDALNRQLDAALATYAAAEPRSGLEARILAHMRSEREQAPLRAWWRWAVTGVLAVAIIVAAALAWKWERLRPVLVEHHAPAIKQDAQAATTPMVAGNQKITRTLELPAPRRAPGKIRAHAHGGEQPRLEQFPSRQPLSEQEKILARYVAEYPEQATLVARARTEQLRRDEAEEAETAKPDSERNR